MAEAPRPAEPTERTPFVPWDRPDRLVTPDIVETARRAGHHRWSSTRLFELLGSWSRAVPERELRPRLAVHAQRFAWHADLWRDRQPEIAEQTPEDSLVPATEGMRAAVESIAGIADEDRSLERLVGAYRVLVPRLLGDLRIQRASTSEITDAPTVRVQALVLADLHEIWADGEMLVQWLIESPADAERAGRQQATLEAMFAADGTR